MRPTLLLLAVLAVAGCENTGAEKDPLIPNVLASRGVQVTSLATLVGTELSLVASEPPEGFATCPEVSREGDVWTFEYGVAGCVPDSGLTQDAVVGTVELTIAGGSGAFLGTVTEFGIAGSTLTASVSGSTSTAGALITADVDLGTATWLQGQTEFTYDAFLEIAGDADDVSLFVDSGELLGESGIPTFTDVDEASTPRTELGGCFVPAGGSLTLLRELGRSEMTFTEETHSTGRVSPTHNDRDPEPIVPCG
jgi:hypothetical protein